MYGAVVTLAQLRGEGEPRRADVFRRLVYAFFREHAESQPLLESGVRRELGNLPDVSKALRWLSSRGLVQKSGTGGRSSPFSYRVQEFVDADDFDKLLKISI